MGRAGINPESSIQMNTLVVLIPWMRKDNTVLGVDEGNEGIEGAGTAVLPGGRSGGGPLQVHDGERQGLGSGTGCFLWHRVGLEVDFPIIIGYLGLVIMPRTKQVLLTPEMALERCLARFSQVTGRNSS